MFVKLLNEHWTRSAYREVTWLRDQVVVTQEQ